MQQRIETHIKNQMLDVGSETKMWPYTETHSFKIKYTPHYLVSLPTEQTLTVENTTQEKGGKRGNTDFEYTLKNITRVEGDVWEATYDVNDVAFDPYD